MKEVNQIMETLYKLTAELEPVIRAGQYNGLWRYMPYFPAR